MSDHSPDLFFPAGESGFAAEQIAVAKRVCSACPVSGECLDYAGVNAQRSGIWGGMTEAERRPLRRHYVARLRTQVLAS